ncbi:hypothetical protein [Streptomyces sp. NBC_01089]|uniref:hypothetical protein n=1 Tax=Streptomyces sp. NBC_01089 TaxID=2903747 RepID=UPI00386BDABD|nr:hypothetical protein OG510_13900 [Streptomyces sp. NBC_01089]
MSASSEELCPIWALRPALPPLSVPAPPESGRTEQFVLSLTSLLPLVYEQAWQAVLGSGFRLQVVDWRATRTEVQDACLAERLARESAGGLPLDQGPSTRATLIRRDDRTWTFAWRYASELRSRRAGLRLVHMATEAYDTLLRGGTPRCQPGADDLLVGPVSR